MSIAADTAVPSFVEEVIADLQGDRLELPGFPEAVLRIQRTLQFPDADVDDVVRILSSEPALAAQALRIANSVMFRLRDGEITDLRTAVNRLGFNLVRSISVAFAIQQLRLGEAYSPAARAEIETIWRDSVSTASICFVLAKHCTKVNPDQALLAGLLHVLGRLYLVMRIESGNPAADIDPLASAGTWHAAIGKAILEAWGLSEKLQHAVEHQDDFDYAAEEVSLTDVLIAAKILRSGNATGPDHAAILERIRAVKNKSPVGVLAEQADEVRVLRTSLGA